MPIFKLAVNIELIINTFWELMQSMSEIILQKTTQKAPNVQDCKILGSVK